MSEEKIYCGSGKIVNTKYGDLTKISFHKDDINKIVKYMKDNKSDWINLALKEKKEPKQGKPTHYLEVDTWKPEQEVLSEQEKKDIDNFNDVDDLPF